MVFVQLIIFHRVCKSVWRGSYAWQPSVCSQDAACPVSMAGVGRESARTRSGPHSVQGGGCERKGGRSPKATPLICLHPRAYVEVPVSFVLCPQLPTE